MGAKKVFDILHGYRVGAGVIQLLVAHIRLIRILSEIAQERIDMIMTEGYGALREGKNFVDPLLAQANGLINSVTVGASGAVFVILLAFGMLFPNTELMLLFPPIPIKAKWFVLGYGAIALYSGFANNANDNVAHFAHLGGMLFGFILIQLWKKDRGNFY
jgi:membrane associated rhomboid family serine protease